MGKTTTELTNEFIKGHPDIKNCLKKGLINYSSLARLIAKELAIEKESSKEAILIAARRFKDKLKNEIDQEEAIKSLLADAETEIKNRINVFILQKGIDIEKIDTIQKKIRREIGIFYLLEGSDNYTLIAQEKHSKAIEESFSSNIIKQHKGLVMINLKTPEEVEEVRGVVAYIASLFAENGVNILEFLSCWNDNLFIIAAEDVAKAIEFLNF